MKLIAFNLFSNLMMYQGQITLDTTLTMHSFLMVKQRKLQLIPNGPFYI